MCIAPPALVWMINSQRRIDHSVAGGPADASVPRRRTRPSEAITGVRRLRRGGPRALEIIARPHARAAPMHAANVLDAFGRQHLVTVVGEIDMLEDADADCLTLLI
jgi:hypothetical protein